MVPLQDCEGKHGEGGRQFRFLVHPAPSSLPAHTRPLEPSNVTTTGNGLRSTGSPDLPITRNDSKGSLDAAWCLATMGVCSQRVGARGEAVRMLDDVLRVDVAYVDGIALISLRGDVDADSVLALQVVLNELDPDSHVQVDMEQVDSWIPAASTC